MDRNDISRLTSTINFLLQNPAAFNLFLASVEPISDEQKPLLRSAFHRISSRGWRLDEDSLARLLEVCSDMEDSGAANIISSFEFFPGVLGVFAPEEQKALTDVLQAFIK